VCPRNGKRAGAYFMSSYQRVALFILFDSLERDLVERIRALPLDDSPFLTSDERGRATLRLERREGVIVDKTDDLSLLPGLDLGEKYQVLMRNKGLLDLAALNYYSSLHSQLDRAIPTRNAVMHGRPLTTTEFALGFSLANDFVKHPVYWPHLAETFETYNKDPEQFIRSSITLLDDEPSGETLHIGERIMMDARQLCAR
jgi:LuxR family glucitol operon transcriptional activator